MSKKKQFVSVFLLLLFMGLQMDAVFHFLFTSHAIDEHGHAVHPDTESDHPSRSTDSDNKDNHDDCRVLASLISGKTRISDETPPMVVIDAPEDHSFFAFYEVSVLRGSDLYRLSPCNSPPSLG